MQGNWNDKPAANKIYIQITNAWYFLIENFYFIFISVYLQNI